jgi:hypothetical protein
MPILFARTTALFLIYPVHLISQVLKLDIDNSQLEMEFIKSIKKDQRLLGSISEIMFEMHYNSPHVNQWFGESGGKTHWIDVLELFYGLRKRGLRIHYWP